MVKWIAKYVFHRCSYKNSCFSKLEYKSSVHVLVSWFAAWNSKKMLLFWKCCFGFYTFGFEAMFLQFVIWLSLWIKIIRSQLFFSFLCNFSSFSSYVGGIVVTKHFSLLLIDRYVLVIQQIITPQEYLRYTTDLQQSSELYEKPCYHGHNRRKWLNLPQSHFP